MIPRKCNRRETIRRFVLELANEVDRGAQWNVLGQEANGFWRDTNAPVRRCMSVGLLAFGKRAMDRNYRKPTTKGVEIFRE